MTTTSMDSKRSRGPETSHDTGASVFVDRFMRNSRLSFIGSWKRRYDELLQDVPMPPPLKPASRRLIFHVDLDAFFCTASLLNRKEWMGKPVCVCWGGGGTSTTTHYSASSSAAEISSCSYQAREFGVKAGMSLARGMALCPNLLCLPFDFDLYEKLGTIFYKTMMEFCVHCECVSCDEAYLDVTELASEKGLVCNQHLVDLANELRSKIFAATGGLRASVGCATNRLLAKMCTSKAKPDGVFCAAFDPNDQVVDQLLRDDFNVGILPSIGWSLTRRLQDLKINTLGELRAVTKHVLQNEFGKKLGENLFHLARGVDDRVWNPRFKPDSVSVQISWGVRMVDLAEVDSFFLELSKKLTERLGSGRSASGIGIKIWRAVPDQSDAHRKGKVGHGECDILTRSKSKSIVGNKPQLCIERIFVAAKELYVESQVDPEDVRGLGIFVTGLSTVAESVFAKWETKQQPSGKDEDMTPLVVVEDEETRFASVIEAKRELKRLLIFAFEDARCNIWPKCDARTCVGCCRANQFAIRECTIFVLDPIHAAWKTDLIAFAKYTVASKWTHLPDVHPLKRFSNCGAAILDLFGDVEEV